MPDYNQRQLRYLMQVANRKKIKNTVGQRKTDNDDPAIICKVWVGFLSSSGGTIPVGDNYVLSNEHKLLFRYDARIKVGMSITYSPTFVTSGLSIGRGYIIKGIENVEGRSKWGIMTVSEDTSINELGQEWR